MGNLRVLTIDDNDSIRLSIASYLEDLGYDVYDANSGESGIKIINENSIDIILTDTHMPGLTGIDVLNYVKDNTPDTPIIIISGAGEIEYAVKALRAGAWDYITKPIEDLNILSYAIDKVLKRVHLINENREKSREIEETNKVLKNTIDKLTTTQNQLVESEKMASLGYMVKGVAHEINTPLGVCMTSTSYIKEQADYISMLNYEHKMKLSDFDTFTKDTKDLTKIIFDSLQTINNLIINFKQLSVDQSSLQLKKFLVSESIQSILLLTNSSYPDKKVTIEMSGEELEINSYPEVYNRIFRKLTENSIIHGFHKMETGKINVNIKSDNENIYIEFCNNGAKIPEEVIHHIFDPFFTINKKMGSGLGLCIVFNLVAFTLLGTVSCKNTTDGVCFSIVLPKEI